MFENKYTSTCVYSENENLEKKNKPWEETLKSKHWEENLEKNENLWESISLDVKCYLLCLVEKTS